MEVKFDKIGEIFGSRLERLLLENIKTVVKDSIGPQLIAKIMEKFDEFAVYFDSKDPSSPVHWRTELEAKLLEELNDVQIEENRIILNLGEKSFLGYGQYDPRSDEPIVWLVHFLEGLVGEYAFIDEQTFMDKKGTNEDFSRYGRFGKGFLIPMDEYMQEGWNMIQPFEQVRFPADVPSDFFMKAAAEFEPDFRDAARSAFIAALEGRKI